MTLRLNGATSGYVEIDCPAAGGNNTLVLPTSNGSAGNILGTDGAGNLSWVNGRMVLETAKASTSGTFVDFTGIPSWVKRVTVMFNGVSTSGTGIMQVQIGDSGGVETSGYNGSTSAVATSTVATVLNSTGVQLYGAGFNAADTVSGLISFSLLSSATNTWAYAGGCGFSNTPATGNAQGSKSLSGTLDRIRITTVNGTDTFDAGSINILVEG